MQTLSNGGANPIGFEGAPRLCGYLHASECYSCFRDDESCPTKLIGPKNKSTIGTTRTSVIFRLENWTKDGTKVDRLLYAGNYLDKARLLFEAAIKHRPRIRLTIRQRVLRPWRRFH
jgi:hypothetical protein